jgi:hypothetical protein
MNKRKPRFDLSILGGATQPITAECPRESATLPADCIEALRDFVRKWSVSPNARPEVVKGAYISRIVRRHRADVEFVREIRHENLLPDPGRPLEWRYCLNGLNENRSVDVLRDFRAQPLTEQETKRL